jgi:FkbM family methyltransferase
MGKALLLRCGEWFSRGMRVLGVRHLHPAVRVQVAGYAQPLYVRLGTSDGYVLQQIFIEREYSPFDGIQPPPRTMVDCGANVGYSSFYFLQRYPELRVIVVEPDSANLAMCRRNLAPFLNRVRFVKAGVWSRPVGLALSGSGWGSKVREVLPGEAALAEGIDMPSLLKMIPEGEIDLLKVDIEWSELEVFGSEPEAWMPKVRNITIELHDPACETVFDRAVAPYRFSKSKFGELTFCRGSE